MTLDTLKRGVLFLLIDLVVQYSLVVCFDVTAAAAAARLDRNEGALIERVHHRRVVAFGTTDISMDLEFVAITSRAPVRPFSEHHPIGDAHRCRQARIEVAQRLGGWRRKLVTRRAVFRRRRDSRVVVMTTGTRRVADGRSLECPLLQPERIVRQILRRAGNELVSRLSLRLISLVADGTTLRLFIPRSQRSVGKSPLAILVWPERQSTHNVYMLIVWKQDLELRHETLAPRRGQERRAQTRERIP